MREIAIYTIHFGLDHDDYIKANDDDTQELVNDIEGLMEVLKEVLQGRASHINKKLKVEVT